MSRLVTNPLTSLWKNACHRVSVPWDSSYILKQHCPRLYKCCGLSNARVSNKSVSLHLCPLRFLLYLKTTLSSNARVWNQSVSLNLGPLRFHQLSSTTSLAPDLPNFSSLSNSRGQVEMLHWEKIQLFLIFLPFVMVKGISFVSRNLSTHLLLSKLEFGN